jgi:hypothetical protein
MAPPPPDRVLVETLLAENRNGNGAGVRENTGKERFYGDVRTSLRRRGVGPPRPQSGSGERADHAVWGRGPQS